jgi:hypothetical protein
MYVLFKYSVLSHKKLLFPFWLLCSDVGARAVYVLCSVCSFCAGRSLTMFRRSLLSETSVRFYQTAWRYIPKHVRLHIAESAKSTDVYSRYLL